MVIIKKLSKRRAWIQVDDTVAWLVTFDKDKTDAEMEHEGDLIKAKKDRLKFVESEIKRLNGTTTTK